MFKQRKKTNKRVIVHDNDENDESQALPLPQRPIKRAKIEDDEEDEDLVKQLGIDKPKEKAKAKHKLKTIETNDDDDADNTQLDKNPKKCKINPDAVASVYSTKPKTEEDGHTEESSSRYSRDDIEKLKASMFLSNKSVADYIQKNDPNHIIKQSLQDDEFDESEIHKMNSIKQLRQRK